MLLLYVIWKVLKDLEKLRRYFKTLAKLEIEKSRIWLSYLTYNFTYYYSYPLDIIYF
jgi:hypothetical protein